MPPFGGLHSHPIVSILFAILLSKLILTQPPPI